MPEICGKNGCPKKLHHRGRCATGRGSLSGRKPRATEDLPIRLKTNGGVGKVQLEAGEMAVATLCVPVASLDEWWRNRSTEQKADIISNWLITESAAPPVEAH